MKRPQSQNSQVLKHLNRRQEITPLYALTRFGIYRLAARIHDLRELGFDIRTIRYKDGQNKWRTRYVME